VHRVALELCRGRQEPADQSRPPLTKWQISQRERPTFATKSAMCGRLRVGKSFLHGFAALVGAAMCSAF
jgi:hypothetical protein